MGRGGNNHSGRSSGGSFGGGSRSSGGRMSGGSSRSSHSNSNRQRFNDVHSSRPSYHPPRSTYHGYPHYHHTSVFRVAPSSIMLFIAVVMFIVFCNLLIFVFQSPQITASTVHREKLDASSVIGTDYYSDELNWIKNSTTLRNGMRKFYEQTGVQPYLYITDKVYVPPYGSTTDNSSLKTASESNATPENSTTFTVDGLNTVFYPSSEQMDWYANYLYEELFSDEGHLLVLFQEHDSGEYNVWYVCGKQAKTVIDDEAANILLDYIDHYYYSSLDDDQMFATAFEKAAARIMTKTTNPVVVLLICLTAVIIVCIAFKWWKRIKRQKNIEAEQTEKILNADLHSFGNKDSELKDLEDKYR